MSWFDRNWLSEAPDQVRGYGAPNRRRALCLMMAAPALSACGFQPLYGTGSRANALRGRISVAAIDGKMGFVARKRLVERLGKPDHPTHRLDITFAVKSDGLAISQTNQITRYNLTGTANFVVVALAADTQVEVGDTRAFAAYSATASPFATRVAEEDARARLAVSLADQITTHLAATAQTWLP